MFYSYLTTTWLDQAQQKISLSYHNFIHLGQGKAAKGERERGREEQDSAAVGKLLPDGLEFFWQNVHYGHCNTHELETTQNHRAGKKGIFIIPRQVTEWESHSIQIRRKHLERTSEVGWWGEKKRKKTSKDWWDLFRQKVQRTETGSGRCVGVRKDSGFFSSHNCTLLTAQMVNSWNKKDSQRRKERQSDLNEDKNTKLIPACSLLSYGLHPAPLQAIPQTFHWHQGNRVFLSTSLIIWYPEHNIYLVCLGDSIWVER